MVRLLAYIHRQRRRNSTNQIWRYTSQCINILTHTQSPIHLAPYAKLKNSHNNMKQPKLSIALSISSASLQLPQYLCPQVIIVLHVTCYESQSYYNQEIQMHLKQGLESYLKQNSCLASHSKTNMDQDQIKPPTSQLVISICIVLRMRKPMDSFEK